MHLIKSLLILLLLSFPVSAQDSAAQPTGTIEVEDSAQQDAAIAVRLRDILSELEGYDDVTVTVSSGIVSLRGTALDGEAITRLGELVSRVDGVVTIENEVTETTDVVQRLNPAIERFVTRIKQAVAFIPLALVALVVFALIVFAGFALARRKQLWDGLAPNAFIADIYRQIIRVATIIAAVVVALDIVGATALLSTILGAAGIIGLAIGFAVRDTVENFIASILLSMRQPFRPNDLIEIGGDMGKVIRLTSRATILLSLDGNHIRIPNATVFKSRIINYTRNKSRRFTFDQTVDASKGLKQQRRVVLDAIKALPFVLETPSPNVWIESADGDKAVLRVSGWVDQRESDVSLARGEAIRKVRDALLEAAKKPAASAKRKAEKESVENVGTAETEELERMIASERGETKAGDLLNRDAMEE
ncbi:mechanosensitive ion channel domain-containing protein [Profundibacter sp.]|uniref:mechanosensitive ion channel domain-containing protein n=1 Tax=Profundibacter sp. TaxID=3101071 RepID=UPI003D138202